MIRGKANIIPALFSLVGVTLLIFSFVSKLLSLGPSQYIKYLYGYIDFIVTNLEVLFISIIHFFSIELLPDSVPDTYIQAFLASLIVSVGYVRALSKYEKSQGKEVFKRRIYLSPIAILIFSFTLVGLSLFVTIIRDSLKGEKEFQIALNAFVTMFYVIFALVIAATMNFVQNSDQFL